MRIAPLMLLIPLLLMPPLQALRIEVEVGEELHFSLRDLPGNATVTWYTESGEVYAGYEFTRQRELEGLRRVTAVVETPGGLESTTFRYYTTGGDWRVYTVPEKNFTSLLELKLATTSVEVTQVEGRGGISLISSSPSGVLLSIQPSDAEQRSLIFIHVTGEMAGQRGVEGVRWNSTPLSELSVEEVLEGEGEGYTFREEEGYLIVALRGPGRLEVLLGGENPGRHIPAAEERDGGGDYTLLAIIVVAVAGGFLLARFLIPGGKRQG